MLTVAALLPHSAQNLIGCLKRRAVVPVAAMMGRPIVQPENIALRSLMKRLEAITQH